MNRTSTPSVVTFCNASHKILSSYYGYVEKPVFEAFLLPANAELGNSGRVLLEHDSATNELFLGLQFGTELELLLAELTQNNQPLSGHVVAVIAEETSHLQALFDAVRIEAGISILNLEVLGEIDRFLTLMHWNTLSGQPPLSYQWRNLHDLCDFMFSGERFGEKTNPLYFDVEALALQHLKKAFAKEWDYTRTDFARVSKEAQSYLQQLRASFFKSLAGTNALNDPQQDEELNQQSILAESA